MATEMPKRLVRFGFTDQIPSLMSAADVLLTKAGPGSICEAMARTCRCS